MTHDPLLDKNATLARQVYAREAAASIVQRGNVLWVFGLALEHPRRALAMVMQSAGGLADGIVTLMATRNWYGASALLRQFIEAEYLVWLFGDDPAECAAWLTEKGFQERLRFRPAKLRKRAAGKFADSEYAMHCEMGGHPHPRGSILLPEHLVAQPAEGERLESLLWLETAVHLQRFWVALEWTIEVLDLKQIGVITEASRDGHRDRRMVRAGWRGREGRHWLGAGRRATDRQQLAGC